jgi:cell division initiation protein
MKITPLEIRQKTFEKAFRGLDKDEVQAYLQSLSQEWERMQDEMKDLKSKLEASEKEVKKLREVESSLFKTLKTAEDTGATLIDQAQKTAELHLREAQFRADTLLSEAKSKAESTIEEAEMIARETMEEMEERLKMMAHAYKSIENFKEDLLAGIKSYATDSLEKIDRTRTQLKSFDVDSELIRIRKETKRFLNDRAADNFKGDMLKIESAPEISSVTVEISQETTYEETTTPEPEAEAPVQETEPQPEPEKEEAPTPKKPKVQSSFFDDIE